MSSGFDQEARFPVSEDPFPARKPRIVSFASLQALTGRDGTTPDPDSAQGSRILLSSLARDYREEERLSDLLDRRPGTGGWPAVELAALWSLAFECVGNWRRRPKLREVMHRLAELARGAPPGWDPSGRWRGHELTLPWLLIFDLCTLCQTLHAFAGSFLKGITLRPTPSPFASGTDAAKAQRSAALNDATPTEGAVLPSVPDQTDKILSAPSSSEGEAAATESDSGAGGAALRFQCSICLDDDLPESSGILCKASSER